MGATQLVLVVKNPAANAGNTKDADSIPKSGRHPLEEGMATHSSILAWRIPWILGILGIPRGGWGTNSSQGCKEPDMTEVT